MGDYQWYQSLIKPSWAPPAWVFGPVWAVLYVIIAVSFSYVFYLFIKKKISYVVFAPFVLNIAFNLIFTPIQFGLKNNFLASLDITAVLATLIWAIISIYPHARWAALANLPYLLWVCFALVLQFTITYLNWGR